MQEVMKLLMDLDWRPLMISVKTGIAATLLAFVLGLIAAWHLMHAGTRLRAMMDSLLTLPMVLPPTAAGFILLVVFGKRRGLGQLLYSRFGISVAQTWIGCVIAAFIIAFPLMYRSIRASFEQVDMHLIYAGRTLGMSEFEIFVKVILPVSKPGLISGTILTFARAMGEYGATSMLAGNISGRTGTISQKIAMVLQDGDFLSAWIWTGIVMLIAFVILLLVYLVFTDKQQKNRW